MEKPKRNPSAASRYKTIRDRTETLYCDVCGWPGKYINGRSRKRVLNVHHIMPLSKGGEDNLDNFMLVCPNHHAILHMIFGHNEPNVAKDKLVKHIRHIESNGPGVDRASARLVKNIIGRVLSGKGIRDPIKVIKPNDIDEYQ